MDVKKGGEERRASVRISVNDGMLAIHANKPGRILDISKGGVAFEYSEDEEWPEGDLTLDVLYGEKDFYLDLLPVETVSECCCDLQNVCKIRKACHRRSLQFGRLSAVQQAQLNYFLKINANFQEYRAAVDPV